MKERRHFSFATLPGLEFDIEAGNVLGGWELYYAGAPLKPHGHQIELHLADGRTEIIEYRNRWDLSPVFIHGEEKKAPLPTIPFDLLLLTLGPLALGLIGGWIGLALGAFGFIANLIIVSFRGTPVRKRMEGIALATALSAAVYVFIAWRWYGLFS